MKKLFIAIFIIILIGLLFFIVRIEEQNLGDNYYYLPIYESIDVGYPHGAIIYKSNQKLNFTDVKVYGNVIFVNHNKNFILAIQTPLKGNPTNVHTVNLETDTLNYYIIVKNSDMIYGPLNYEKYMLKREELGIPKRLQLKVKN